MFIILHNPMTKNKKARRRLKRVVNYFKRRNIRFRLKSLLKIDDLEAFIKRIPSDSKLVLLGGDGTINAFINRTYNLHVAQSIYLMGVGSGNDFLRSLKRQNTGHQFIRRMKYGRKSRFFINGSGLGMDGQIAHRVNQSPRTNRFNYFLSAIKTFATFRPKYMEVEIDGKLHTFKKGYLLNVNSGEYIGGGMRLTPDANLDDDQLEVLVVHRISRPFLFLIFLSVYFGFHTRFKRYIFRSKGHHVKATMFSSQIAQCDGETFRKVRDFEAWSTDKRVTFLPFDLDKHTK